MYQMNTMNFVKGNVVAQKFSEPTILVHCCNTYNGFGSGVAGAISKVYPKVKRAYHDWFGDSFYECDVRDTEVPFMMGQVQLVQIDQNLYVCNMLGQSYPGGEKFQIGEKSVYLRPVRLDSIRECLYNVAVLAKQLNAKVVGPRFCGGLAGADFMTEVVPLIQECLLAFDIDVTIYDLE